VIRRLWPFARARLRDHLLRLHHDERVLRFGGHLSAARIAAYCERRDWSGTLVIGCIAAGEVRRVGQLTLISDAWPRKAELAVSVERRFQNRASAASSSAAS